MKQRRGSTMVMVVFTIGVLWLIGVTLSSIAVANMRVRKAESSQKIAFYAAESGIDQVYAILVGQVEAGIDSANAYVLQQQETFQDSIKDSFTYGSAVVIDGVEYMSPDGELNSENVEAKFPEWFKEGFKKFFYESGQEGKTFYDTTIANGEFTVQPVSDGYSAPTITVEDEPNSYNFTSDEDSDKMLFSITSEYTQVDGKISAKRRLHANLVVGIPEYETPYTLTSNKVETKVHPLFTKAITSDGDMTVLGDAYVTGDVYVYGREGSGVVIGSSTVPGSLNILSDGANWGNLVCRNDIITNRNSSFATSENSYVFCSTIEVPTGETNADINIRGNINTADDIVLNGKNTSILIDGSYYGFSDSSQGKEADRGSSIIINSPDIGIGSEIEINGNHKETGEMGAGDTDYGIFINGTVYISGSDKYQTGESVAIKGNYLAYSRPLTGITAAEYGEEYGDDVAIYNDNNIKRKYFATGEDSYLELADGFSTRDASLAESSIYSGEGVIDDDSADKMSSTEKGKYISLYDKENPTVLNLGNGAVRLNNVVHALGAYIRQKSGDEYELAPSCFNLADASIAAMKRRNLYEFLTQSLNPLNYAVGTSNSIDAEALEDNRLSVSSAIRGSVEKLDVNASSGHKIAIINSDPTKTVAIIGQGGSSVPSADYIFNCSADSKILGAIFTAGDVFVTGTINDYQGTIAAGGDIYLLDNVNKNFASNTSVVLRLIFDMEDRDAVSELAYANGYFTFSDLSGVSGIVQDIKDGFEDEYIYKSEAVVEGIVTNYTYAETAVTLEDFRRVY